VNLPASSFVPRRIGIYDAARRTAMLAVQGAPSVRDPAMAAFLCHGRRWDEETGTGMARRGYPIGALLGALVALPAGPAGAQEYCVACSGPNAVYRCVIDGAKPGGPSLQMLCIATLAKEGGHATCGIKRGTVFECDGPVKRVPWAALDGAPRPNGAQASPPSALAPQPPRTEPDAAADAEPEGQPQTIVDLAKRANEQTVEQMKKAGATVKDATKKTWDCMVSLFTRC
jgi:hypothetical protein